MSLQNVLFGVFVGFLMVMLAFALGGCTPSTPTPAAVVAPTGTAIDKAGAYISTAEYANSQAKPHTDPVGRADLDIATNAHKSAADQLTQAKTALFAVQSAYAAVQDQLRVALDQVSALLHSPGHVVQVWVERFLVVLAILIGLHFVAVALTYFLPLPYSVVAGWVANIVNPIGWGNWLATTFIAHARARAAVAASQIGIIVADPTAPKPLI